MGVAGAEWKDISSIEDRELNGELIMRDASERVKWFRLTARNHM